MKPKFGTDEWVEEVFKYHVLREDQIEKFKILREASMVFSKTLLEVTPPCADQSAAMRHFRECLMTAYCSIKLDGLI